MINRRKVWYRGENIAASYFLEKGYKLVKKNFTIRGWEIDLIFEKDNLLLFVEVKVVDSVDDIFWYITKRKIKYLKKTIFSFLAKNPKYLQYDKKLVFVFIKGEKILDIYDYFE